MLKFNLKKKFSQYSKVLKGYYPEVTSFLFGIFILIGLLSTGYHDTGYSAKLSKATDYLVEITSILSGIVIAFLAAKVIQIRQEKLNLRPDLMLLTHKVHYFRKILQFLQRTPTFWPNGLVEHMKKEHPNLTFFEVRDVTYVDKVTSDGANAFFEDTKFGEIPRQVYLEIECFLPVKHFDHTLYTEFEIDDVTYSTELLDLWEEYNCGNMLWSCFVNEYRNYKHLFSFEDIKIKDREEINRLALKIDYERYKDIEFGPKLIGMLGSQIEQNIMPKLNKLQRECNLNCVISLF